MPTSLKEQLFAGIHQTERQLARVPVEQRAALTDELDAYLDQVRAFDGDEQSDEFRALFTALHQLHVKIVEAGRR
jgi:hypothetical protein